MNEVAIDVGKQAADAAITRGLPAVWDVGIALAFVSVVAGVLLVALGFMAWYYLKCQTAHAAEVARLNGELLAATNASAASRTESGDQYRGTLQKLTRVLAGLYESHRSDEQVRKLLVVIAQQLNVPASDIIAATTSAPVPPSVDGM